jgi:hypothetical protein
LFGPFKDLPEFLFTRKIMARTPVYSYYHTTCNLEELANEMEGFVMVDYFVIEDLKEMTIGITWHKMG